MLDNLYVSQQVLKAEKLMTVAYNCVQREEQSSRRDFFKVLTRLPEILYTLFALFLERHNCEKMVSKSLFMLALAIGAIAVLYQIDVEPGRWESSESATIHASREQLERFITNPDSVDKWFQWVALFKAADSRPLGIGKKYHAVYILPLLGEYVMLFKVTEYMPNRLLVLESDSSVKPRLTIQMEDSNSKASYLTLKLRYRRISALFQWTVGPLLYFLTSQQLQHSLFMLRMIFPF